MRLNVHVKGKLVAHLNRQADDYALRYTDDATADNFVGLTMPVRENAWVWPRDLHPFFRQNLPEGFLLQVIREQFGPYLDGTDLSLLAVIGSSGIGRVTVSPEGGVPGGELEPIDLKRLLHEDMTTDHFAELVRYYARAAISGAVPKFLAPESSSFQTPVGKQTLRTSRHIIKGSDEQTPYLGFNEHYSMQVLARLGVARVANTTMSDDGRVLVVDRFDVDEQGKPAYGVEDACSLLGLPPHEKYRPSMEQVVNATKPYVHAANWRRQAEQLGWLIITNHVVRNADCHAKNIALLYSGIDDVLYTPAYDIVTTEAYPRFANNPPALSIDGRKTWAPGKTLERFFNTRLGIPPKQYREMVEALCDSAVSTGKAVAEAAKNDTRWHWVARQMLHAWNEGMASLRSAKPQAALRALTPVIDAAGFSDADKADNGREVIGRSELLGERGKRG
ncbi:type II toxin-antitoxin system HipA family toxin [Burkholderia territorii]|uniref:type II toxin-antitoxin system HipA family toxin n=1 Tax=Burkholderia territorii TaxID=1503055 RepID=UPI00075D0790|nr:type II toxin-antitoxin system HipA family toxin [Burkholderia territorii]KVQ55804.1 toxin HipA [Burkholderia territorii]KVT81944.1 toxin HipA [Burkholderia territorii]KWA37856.1 toxin HipA [Burkholderia territorii]